MNNPIDLANGGGYVLAIAFLLPLSATMLVTQVNPYHALVIRGILGAIAALLYALLGAADVALTEALVGTMLSITLYAIAVRSSMSMRLGVLASALETAEMDNLTASLRPLLNKHYLRLELVPYSSRSALQSALLQRDIHTLCLSAQHAKELDTASAQFYLETRLQRLYTILQPALSPTMASLVCNIPLPKQTPPPVPPMETRV
ncbi:MAG: hydrogenase subunit MbhD domain-containing protein [Cyanobacteria bacterium P01_H01_bin.26]